MMRLLHVTLFVAGLVGTWAVVHALQPAALRDDAQIMHFRTADRWLLPDRPSAAEQLRFLAATNAAWPHPQLAGLPIQRTPEVGAYDEWFGTGYALPRMQDLLKNVTWKPDSAWFLCYRGPQQPYFDRDGCVELRFNRFGLRDRADLTLAKPTGYRRIVCIGDSLTLAWGVRAAQSWPVLLEQQLLAEPQQVQVVNAGGTGSAYVDEYALALAHRHGRFDPDLVLVTLCLNDLLVTNGRLGHFRPDALPFEQIPAEDRAWWMESALLRDMHRRLAGGQALDLGPDRDWVQELLDLPDGHLYYAGKGESRAMYWPGGMPQAGLRAMRDWCRARNVRFAVVVWPLLQGLGEGRYYPFAKMHGLLREFCAAEAMPLLDLLPTFATIPHETLWVSPFDMHPNERAHELAAPALAAFCLELLSRP